MKEFFRKLLVVAVIFGGAYTIYVNWGNFGQEKILADNPITENLNLDEIDVSGLKEMSTNITGYIMEELNKPNYELPSNSGFDDRYPVYEGTEEFILHEMTDGFSEISADMGGCIFRVCKSEDGKRYLQVKGVERYQIYIEDEVLFIRAVGDTTGLGNITEDNIREINISAIKEQIPSIGEIILYIPEESELETASIKLGMGFGQVESINTKELEIQCSAGAFIVQRAHADKASLKCRAGNLELNLDEKTDAYDYDIKNTAGIVQFGDKIYNGIAAEENTGNSDKKIYIECSLGNIKVQVTPRE